MDAKHTSFLTVIAAFILGLPLAHAQLSPPATGICKDGTHTSAPTKDGACRGHKGVQTWYSPAALPSGPAAPPSGPATTPPVAPQAPAIPPGPPGPPPTASTTPKPGIAAERAKLATMQPAPGGGPGLVWLNGSSKVYHCPTSEFYGKTKTGSYLPEVDAKATGAHPNHNKPCS